LISLPEVEDMHDDMADLMDQAEEMNELMGRSFAVPGHLIVCFQLLKILSQKISMKPIWKASWLVLKTKWDRSSMMKSLIVSFKNESILVAKNQFKIVLHKINKTNLVVHKQPKT
jgi:hypothetical protein